MLTSSWKRTGLWRRLLTQKTYMLGLVSALRVIKLIECYVIYPLKKSKLEYVFSSFRTLKWSDRVAGRGELWIKKGAHSTERNCCSHTLFFLAAVHRMQNSDKSWILLANDMKEFGKITAYIRLHNYSNKKLMTTCTKNSQKFLFSSCAWFYTEKCAESCI